MPPDWYKQARCRDLVVRGEAEPDWWFPGDGTPGFDRDDHATLTQAIAICDKCHVRDDCLTHALDHPERHGIWGGVGEKPRRVMRKRRGVYRFCPECGHRFATKIKSSGPERYCSDPCRKAAVRATRRRVYARRKAS